MLVIPICIFVTFSIQGPGICSFVYMSTGSSDNIIVFVFFFYGTSSARPIDILCNAIATSAAAHVPCHIPWITPILPLNIHLLKLH